LSLPYFISILKHISSSLGAEVSSMHDYDAVIVQYALRLIMDVCVHVTHPVTVDIIFNGFQVSRSRFRIPHKPGFFSGFLLATAKVAFITVMVFFTFNSSFSSSNI